MKKTFPRILLVLFGIIAGIVVSGAVYAFTGFSIFGKFDDDVRPTAKTDNAGLTALAYDILTYIKEGDYAALSREAHPEFGVVFSPCATIALSTNRCFRADQIASFGGDTTLYVWGVRSGSGEPIEMTPADYFARYVFDRDYTSAAIVGVNQVIRSGNALENFAEFFPYAKFVDFYMSGGEGDASAGPGWSSIRLGFEEYDGALRLTVIIHSEWTE